MLKKSKILNPVLLFLVFYYWTFTAAAQSKRLLDTSAYKDWKIVNESPKVSNDGKYAVYAENVYLNSSYGKIYIKGLHNHWIFSTPGVSLASLNFSDDSKRAIFLKGNELHLLSLGTELEKVIPNVTSYQLIIAGKSEFLVYRTGGMNNDLVINNINLEYERKLTGIQDVAFANSTGRMVYIQTKGHEFAVKMADVLAGREESIWNGRRASDLIIDANAERIAFKSEDEIYYYHRSGGLKAVKLKVDFGSEVGFSAKSLERFSKDGKRLFFKINAEEHENYHTTSNPVEVWSYHDARFGKTKVSEVENFLAVCNVETGKALRIEQPGWKVTTYSPKDENVVVSTYNWDHERYWNRKAVGSSYLLNLNTGTKRPILFASSGMFEFSSGEKFLICVNSLDGDLYSWDLIHGTVHNLTNRLPIPAKEDKYELGEGRNLRAIYMTGWPPSDDRVIIGDRYDLWQLDPNGLKAPICLTNGYGRREQIEYQFIDNSNSQAKYFRMGSEVVLNALDSKTQDNGFYKIVLGKQQDPVRLMMGAYKFSDQMGPLKARDSDLWLVNRSSVAESPNFLWTTNFKNFKLLSDVHSEREYQWHTSELIRFTTRGGISTQAVLYKPDNFDPNKKYPVLFTYYEKEGWKLNEFEQPDLPTTVFNIPLMLSRGYLVCRTNIHFQLGETANSIVEAIDCAADELAKRPYIDSKHFGAMGHSFGGYGTNCLAAFSHKFSALISVAGPCDLMSFFGASTWGGGISGANTVENTQLRMGVSLSVDPQRYLRNSPVAFAKDVTTPILIVHTLEDDVVPISQSIEWFTSLRREGKRAWMLSYPHGGHSLNRVDAPDFYIRMNQFFDHYLKDAPAPIWMTRGISANDTGKISGYEYDPEIMTPGPGLNTPEDLRNKALFEIELKNKSK